MTIKINDKILTKATIKLEDERALEEYLSTCLKARLCPHCGEQLMTISGGKLACYKNCTRDTWTPLDRPHGPGR